jgi:hypothetical protein
LLICLKTSKITTARLSDASGFFISSTQKYSMAIEPKFLVSISPLNIHSIPALAIVWFLAVNLQLPFELSQAVFL